MRPTNEQMRDRMDSDILFSKTVKAGKRVYYIDVKHDRRDEVYISVTESKRIKEGSEDMRPVFEKHKIFLYRQDLEKFMAAFNSAAIFAEENCSLPEEHYNNGMDLGFITESQQPNMLDTEEEEQKDESDGAEISSSKPNLDFRLDIDF